MNYFRMILGWKWSWWKILQDVKQVLYHFDVLNRVLAQLIIIIIQQFGHQLIVIWRNLHLMLFHQAHSCIFPIQRTIIIIIEEIHWNNQFSFISRAPVQLNVFSYDESSFNEGKYKKVDEIPTVPLAPMTPMLCKYEINAMLSMNFQSGNWERVRLLTFSNLMDD